MGQSSDGPGFAFEALERLSVGREVLGQDFHSDVAAEARVASTVHLAHAAFAERGPDLVRTKLGTGCQSHCPYSRFSVLGRLKVYTQSAPARGQVGSTCQLFAPSTPGRVGTTSSGCPG